MKKEWFAEWFGSPYYHLLYKSRDEKEAEAALGNLLLALDLSPGSRVLDLACGRGRHARYLAEKGFQVTGLDISPENISFARQYEQKYLEFYENDMRKPFRINYFDVVLNMFTSFGYFKNDADHLISLKHVTTGLRPGGQFLIDFFNAGFVKNNLLPSETKTVDQISFSLKRWIKAGYVFKSVQFEAEGRTFHFQEQVRLFELSDFQSLLSAAGLHLQQIYGGYDLSAYDEKNARRLIIIAKKP